MPIHKITAPLAISTLNPLAEAGYFEMVKRLCSRLNMIMNYAINTGIIPKGSNPLVGIKADFAAPEPVQFPAVGPAELPELLKTVEESKMTPIIRNLFYFQLHTMTRPSEAAGAKWDEIEGDLWTIPGERMKRRKEHIVILTSQIQTILEDMREIAGNSEFVFPSRSKPRKPVNSESVNTALKRMGFKGRQTGHGLRALSSTTLNEHGHDAELIEVSLSHIDKNVSRRPYNRSEYIDRRRVLMAWWSDYITAAQSGGEVKGKKHLKIAN
jgi:integrase